MVTSRNGIFWDFWYVNKDTLQSLKPLKNLLLQLVAGWPIFFHKMTGLFVSLRILGQFYNFRAILQVQAPKGLIFGGWFNGCFFFCITSLGGLYYFGRAYTWRGLFSEFYGVYFQLQLKTHLKQRCPFGKTDSIIPIPIRRGLNS